MPDPLPPPPHRAADCLPKPSTTRCPATNISPPPSSNTTAPASLPAPHRPPDPPPTVGLSSPPAISIEPANSSPSSSPSHPTPGH
ncbi:hypothetical protein [Oryza sativa Japonica Group]|uniref:Uncharacterized protein n=1 Tax=Oryza sativa subsp. japonica TaxID=39947 RepID=Q5N9L0_ORYSJ|nr:hypothetical protein [Oryza sativa Japonica Group]